MTYTGAVGDVNDNSYVYDNTAAASFVQDDWLTASFDVSGVVTGCDVKIQLLEFDAGNNPGTAHVSPAMTLTQSLQRVSYGAQLVDADCDNVRIYIIITGIDDGDSFDVYFGAVNAEKKAYTTSFCCGALDHCAWSGDEDDSSSTRTVTEVNLDAYADLLSDEDTWSLILWWQPQYDADADWPDDAIIFDVRGANDNNRMYVEFEDSDDKYHVYINGADRFQSSAQTFSAGQWQSSVLTVDFGNDEYYFYAAGVKDGSDTTNLTAPTALVEMNLGSDYQGTNQANCYLGEAAIFGKVLTLIEIANIYALQRPLVDAGALDVSGIYILDGKFTISSSTTGLRTTITPSEISIGTGITFAAGAGIWMGIDSAEAKLFIGSHFSSYIEYDGTDVTITADVTIQNPADIDGSTINNDSGWTDDTAADAAQADATQALSDASDAQITADGKIVSFWQDAEPGAGMSEGDIWFDTNDGNKAYRYDGADWLDAQDDDIAQALSDASDAQSTACLLYTSPSPRDATLSRMPSSA